MSFEKYIHSIHAIHPLMRVADRFRQCASRCGCDSSPPTRGKPFSYYRRATMERFIPSYEGQTNFSANFRVLFVIHPLLRGANCTYLKHPDDDTDSSPSCEWADIQRTPNEPRQHDLSPPTRGKRGGIKMLKTFCPIHPLLREANVFRRDSLGVIVRFIPSYEGQT